MNQKVSPIGVSIVHLYYPGFIDLPPDTQYIIRSPDLSGSVQMLAHVRPLIVTDFNNGLVRKKANRGRQHTDLRRKIGGIKKDSLAIDARGFEGREGPTIAIEKDIGGRVFYQDVYTSLYLCTEFDSLERAENIGLQTYIPLLERFISTYRYLNPDIRVALRDGLPEAETPIRIGYYTYSPAERRLPFEERITNAQPARLDISIVALGDGARALQDHVGDKEKLASRAECLGSHLWNGFALSENMLAIERLADLAFSGKQPRSAVIEAMSICEVAILQAQQRFIDELKSRHKVRKPNQITWKFLIDAILPALLDLFDGDKSSMMKRAKEVVCLRHRVVHKAYMPTSEEANYVLSFVRTLLGILELPEQFKGNWKRKSV